MTAIARGGESLYGGELVTEVAGLWAYGYVARVSGIEAWVTYGYDEVDGEGSYPQTMRYDAHDLIVCDPQQTFAPTQ